MNKLYNTAKSLMGKHLSLNDSVPMNVGCAQALSFVLKQCGYPIPAQGLDGTIDMYHWLVQHFDEVNSPEAGDVIVSVTGTGNGSVRGHTGVVALYGILSNESQTGLWKEDWTLPAWLIHYQTDGQLLTTYFRPR